MVDFKNVRITVAHREGDKDWEGTGRNLNISAYQNPALNKKLFQGPDIPISSTASDEEIERQARLLFELICGQDDEHRAAQAA